MKEIKIIVTLGPSTRTESDLRRLKEKGADFVRVNMSHSSVEDLKYFITLANKVGIPFILDTEGSQIRSGKISGGSVFLEESDEVKIHIADIDGDGNNISLRPGHIVAQLEEGDLLYPDFDSLVLRVSSTANFGEGYIVAKALAGGSLGSNKGVVIDPVYPKAFSLPALSPKDLKSIEVGLREKVKYIAASFMRSGEFVDAVREATECSMKIISKVECLDAIKNLDEIIERSDSILIDRGDLSKEIPLEKIPFAQKIIIQKALKKGKDVFVATNLLETMIEKSKPTRAEVHDVIATALDGASGVILSAETAIGKHPMECVSVMRTLLEQAYFIADGRSFYDGDHKLDSSVKSIDYLVNRDTASVLIAPHGGKLIERFTVSMPQRTFTETLPKIQLSEDLLMDTEQIATGVFSPLEGFMGREDVESVLSTMRLASGTIWPLPVVLDVSQIVADSVPTGSDAALTDSGGEVIALLHVEDKYIFDKTEYAKKLYGTIDENHPGVRRVMAMNPVFIAGKVDLLKRRKQEFGNYALTPRQVRRIFSERHWSRVVGFHTRNVIHRSHEYIQLKALEDECCDGLFVHPVVGKKKQGDYHASYIIKSYERMMNGLYPKGKVVFAAFNAYSRYAGPREALFTAICRQNFGCSHFIVGRDHTGVGNFYLPYASHKIFDEFPDLEIKPVRFNEVFYSKRAGNHVHMPENQNHDPVDKFSISGTEARKMFERGEAPPEWFMRTEISKIITAGINSGDDVFIKKKNHGTTIWFTGLSGSGKSTIALKLKEMLELKGKNVAILDGDDVRKEKHAHLGFSREDIRENNRLIAKLALKKAQEADVVLVPIISPYREDRAMARSIIGEGFAELFVNAPFQKCVERDVKGLYKKALTGEIADFIGIARSNPYEPPHAPDIEVDTTGMNIEQCIEKILKTANLL